MVLSNNKGEEEGKGDVLLVHPEVEELSERVGTIGTSSEVLAALQHQEK